MSLYLTPEIPDDIKKTLDKHETEGTIDSQEYMDAVMVYYKRNLNIMDPWPQELDRSFEVTGGATMENLTPVWKVTGTYNEACAAEGHCPCYFGRAVES